MTDPIVGGQTLEWWQIGLAAVTAVWGGLVGYFRAVQDGMKPTVISLIMHLSTSGFAGLLCWLGCMQLQANGYMTAICTGLAGHMGVEFVKILQKRFANKIDSTDQGV